MIVTLQVWFIVHHRLTVMLHVFANVATCMTTCLFGYYSNILFNIFFATSFVTITNLYINLKSKPIQSSWSSIVMTGSSLVNDVLEYWVNIPSIHLFFSKYTYSRLDSKLSLNCHVPLPVLSLLNWTKSDTGQWFDL